MLRCPTVLVVDDEPINVKLVERTLKDGYETIAAADGHQAVALLKEREVDLILLDVMMPGLSGFDVLKIVKADPHLADIPVVFLTAMNPEQGERQGLDLGAIDYLSKPVDLELLRLRARNLTDLKLRGDLVREQRDLLARRTAELEEALARVKQLEGVLPICMYCKKIKDDKESWQQLEQYLARHSDVMFSHSACPECFEREMKALREECPG